MIENAHTLQEDGTELKSRGLDGRRRRLRIVTEKFRYKRRPLHRPGSECARYGLLSPALSARGGEGEDSATVRGFKARILSGNSNNSPVAKLRCHCTSHGAQRDWRSRC